MRTRTSESLRPIESVTVFIFLAHLRNRTEDLTRPVLVSTYSWGTHNSPTMDESNHCNLCWAPLSRGRFFKTFVWQCEAETPRLQHSQCRKHPNLTHLLRLGVCVQAFVAIFCAKQTHLKCVSRYCVVHRHVIGALLHCFTPQIPHVLCCA